jgi:dephospho-CoA kinase
MMVIGFTGRRGCGKDTAAKHLEGNFGFRMLDFTRDVLAPILEEQGKPVTRDNLIELAMDGRKKAHNGIWAEKLSGIIMKGGGKNYVISGIRFREEVETFRSNFRKGFRLVAIVCDDMVRFERVRKRGTKGEAAMTFEKFMETEKKPTEMAIREAVRMADFVIDNNGTLDELYGELKNLMKILKR